jgi:hypothetical protein
MDSSRGGLSDCSPSRAYVERVGSKLGKVMGVDVDSEYLE